MNAGHPQPQRPTPILTLDQLLEFEAQKSMNPIQKNDQNGGQATGVYPKGQLRTGQDSHAPALILGYKRKQERRRTLKSGRVFYILGRSTLDVRITNQSLSGAKITLDSLWLAPSIFDLHVLNPNTGHPARIKCELVWNRGYEMGVRCVEIT